MIQLICGECISIMEGMARRMKPSFDMIFLDPPYFSWEGQYPKPDHYKLSMLTYSLLKPTGVVWLCGTQPQLLEDWKYWKRKFRLVFELIQYKHGGTPLISPYQPIRVHENIWCLFRKDQKISQSKLDIRRATKGTYTKKRAKKGEDAMTIRYGKTWVEWKEDVGYPKSVIECLKIGGGSKEYEGHPTQKPLRLMELIIKVSTEQGDWILDPFAGSGTTLVAAEELGRNCLAIEINPAYCKIIKRRLNRLRGLRKLEKWIEREERAQPAHKKARPRNLYDFMEHA